MRITRGDGLIDRDQAAELCGVTPDAVTIWATRGYWTRDRAAPRDPFAPKTATRGCGIRRVRP